MRGKVCTYQKCPECGRKFEPIISELTLTVLACPAHNSVRPNRLYLDIYHAGQRYKISRDEKGQLLTSCELASALLAEIRRQHGFNPSKYVRRKLEPYYLSNIIKEWLESAERAVEMGDMARGTLEWKGRQVDKHIKPYFGNAADIREIQTYHIEQFRQQLNMGPVGRNNIMWQMQSIWKYALEQDYIDRIKPHFKTSKIPKKEVRVISRENIAKVLDKIDPQHRPIFEFGTLTGCRKSEARALQWEDINWTDGYIVFRHNYSGSGKNERLVKRLKENQIKFFPLIDSIRAILGKLDRQLSGTVFMNPRTGKPYSNHMTPILSRAFRRAGVPAIPLENFFRHSAASYWLESGMQLSDVSQLLGHASIRTTENHYIKTRVKRLGQVLEFREKTGKVTNVSDSK